MFDSQNKLEEHRNEHKATNEKQVKVPEQVRHAAVDSPVSQRSRKLIQTIIKINKNLTNVMIVIQISNARQALIITSLMTTLCSLTTVMIVEECFHRNRT